MSSLTVQWASFWGHLESRQLSEHRFDWRLTIPDCRLRRDVFNEKPTADEIVPAEDDGGAAASALPRGAVIHTTRGDIWLRLYPEECPKVPNTRSCQ